MTCIYINGVPMNVWPILARPHLREIGEVEDAEYEEIKPTNDYEETERNN